MIVFHYFPYTLICLTSIFQDYEKDRWTCFESVEISTLADDQNNRSRASNFLSSTRMEGTIQLLREQGMLFVSRWMKLTQLETDIQDSWSKSNSYLLHGWVELT